MNRDIQIPRRPATEPLLPRPANELADMLILRRFVPQAECKSIRDTLASQQASKKATRQAPYVVFDDEVHRNDVRPVEILNAFLADRRYFDPLMQFLDEEARTHLSAPELTVKSLDGLTQRKVLAAFAMLKDDPTLVTRSGPAPGAPTSELMRLELADLQERGVLAVRDGRWVLARELSPHDARQIRWLNIRILEEVLFPGNFVKGNRLYANDAAIVSFAARAARPCTFLGATLPALADILAGSPNRVAARLTGTSLFDSQCALAEILFDADLRDLVFRAYVPTMEAAAPDHHRLRGARALLGDVRACQLLLHELFPAQILRPRDNDREQVDPLYHDSEVFDWSAVAEVLEPHIVRLVGTIVEPFYGVAIGKVLQTNIVRYRDGGYVQMHVDRSPRPPDLGGAVDKETDHGRQWERDFSLLVYFSKATDFDGGELVFPRQGISIKPDEGMVVLFPSDERFPHHVRPTHRGDRYVSVGWLKRLA